MAGNMAGNMARNMARNGPPDFGIPYLQSPVVFAEGSLRTHNLKLVGKTSINVYGKCSGGS